MRCAVLSGAPKLQLSRAKGAEGTGFLAKFAGQPFGAEELADICAPVLADIGDDGLLLDASLSGCVRDERFAALQPLLEQKAFALLRKEVSRQELSFHAVSRLLEKWDNRQLWRERMSGRAAKNKSELAGEPGLLAAVWRYLTGGGGADQPYPPTVSETRLRLIEEAGRRTWWLQDACRRALGGSLKEGGSPEAALLRGVPVLFSALGEPLSLNKVRKRRSNGGLKVLKDFATEQNSGGRHPKDAVWLASDRDREFLRSFVPESEWMD